MTAKAASTASPTAFKPLDVEEQLDIWFYRPAAQRLVEVLRHTRLTPHQVTLLSGAVGLVAGVVLCLTMRYSLWWAVLAGLLMPCSTLLDCADGQLARVRGQSSITGRALDGLIDPIMPIAVFHGFGLFLLGQGLSFWYIWPVGWLAGLSMVVHTNMYDHAKNVYLHNAREPIDVGGRPLVSLDDIERERRHHLERGERALAFFVWVFWHYTKDQRRRGKTAMEQDTPITTTAAEREIYREVFLPHMRLWTWMGLSTHNLAVALTVVLIPFAPWLVHVLWFVLLVPANLLCLYLVRSKERLIEEYRGRVAALAPGS